MFIVTVYKDDGTIEEENTFRNIHAALMLKACAFRIGYKKVEITEMPEEQMLMG